MFRTIDRLMCITRTHLAEVKSNVCLVSAKRLIDQLPSAGTQECYGIRKESKDSPTVVSFRHLLAIHGSKAYRDKFLYSFSKHVFSFASARGSLS